MDFLEGEILVVDKPLGWTSFDVVNKVRWHLSKALHVKKIKVGHAGTLDPLATGVVILTTGKKTKLIGKELEIRRSLSRCHLYSSAFVVEKTQKGFILHGAGWGHGVGLCQIGAAAMGARGYGYQEILQHYYPNSTLKTIY